MPSKRQDRRAISIKAKTYQRLRDYCERERAEGRLQPSISGVIEELVAAAMDLANVPVPTYVPPKKPKQVEPPAHGQHFTF